MTEPDCQPIEWVLAEGLPAPLGASWRPRSRAWNFALYSKHATRRHPAALRPRRLHQPLYRIPLRLPGQQVRPRLALLDSRATGSPAPATTPTAWTGRGMPPRGSASTRRRCCSIRTPGPCSSRRRSIARRRRAPAATPGGRRSACSRPAGARTGGHEVPAAPRVGHRHLRDARAGLHAPRQLRRPPGPPRHLRRASSTRSPTSWTLE